MAGFGDEVKRLRLQRGWTQEDLGERADLDQATISQIERGIAAPTARSVRGLARAFGEKPARFFTLSGLLPDDEEQGENEVREGDVLLDILHETRRIVSPEALAVLERMREVESPDVYLDAVRLVAEAWASNFRMGGGMAHLGRRV